MTTIKQTAVRVGDAVFCVDTIEHEGGVWLVPEWIELPGQGFQKPARIIRIDLGRLQAPEGMVFDYVLNDELPEAVLDGRTTEGFEVQECPDIVFSHPSGAH